MCGCGCGQLAEAYVEFCGALRHDPANVFVLIQLKRLEAALGETKTRAFRGALDDLADVEPPIR